MMATFPLPRGSYRWGSPFGPRPSLGGFHGGQDFPTPAGTPIHAPHAGRVSQFVDASGGGLWTGITAPDGSYWGLGHALRFVPGVNGTTVPEGALVAYSGYSGHVVPAGPPGAHLHAAYRARPGAPYTDPAPLLRAAEAAGRFPGAPPAPPPPPTLRGPTMYVRYPNGPDIWARQLVKGAGREPDVWFLHEPNPDAVALSGAPVIPLASGHHSIDAEFTAARDAGRIAGGRP